MRRVLPALALLLMAACSQQPEQPAGTAEDAPPASAASTPAPAPRASPDADTPGRRHVYTSLENCPVVRQQTEEMPMTEVKCPGAGMFDIRILDADARQTMTVIDPAGTAHTLATARIGGGGFSSFGKTAEWRGGEVAPVGGHFEPDSLIVRYDVAEAPHPAPEASYLLVVKLARTPCVVAKVPAGPQQNNSARKAADASGACLAD